MAVGVLQEFEATTEQYDAVNAKLDTEGNPPEGGMVHSASDLGGGKMRVFDIWETKEAFEKFMQERLGPTITEVVGPDAPPPTLLEVNELHDLNIQG